jgi:transposase
MLTYLCESIRFNARTEDAATLTNSWIGVMVLEEQLNHLYIGVDLHKATHTGVFINCWNMKLGEVTFANKPSAFPKFLKEVNKHLTSDMTPIYGLEDTGGNGRALAVYLVEQKQLVKEVNPALAFTKRQKRPTNQKSDSIDAESIARVLRDELNSLPDANPKDIYWAISQMVTRRKAVAKALSTLVRQLHNQLSYHYPSYKKFFSELDGKSALAFWDMYPSPKHIKGVSVEDLAQFLRSYSNNSLSTKKAEQILALIKGDGDTTREYQDKRDFIIQSHVRHIQFSKEELLKIEQQIENLLTHLDFRLESMTGIDVVTAASFVAEIGDIQRFDHPNKLARHAGVAPVYRGSGGKGRNFKSKLGNRELHDLFYSLAVRQIAVTRGKKEPRNPLFYEYYHRKIEEGKTERQALICSMRRLVNILYGMMKYNRDYTLPPLHDK